MKAVNGQTMFLHDGRAKTFEEHEGEAAGSQAAFGKLPKADCDDLVFFLGSI